MRRYIFGLALVAATEPLDGFLRQGCLLTQHPDKPPKWEAVGRDGRRTEVDLDQDRAFDYAQIAKEAFPVAKDEVYEFSKELAHSDLSDTLGKASNKGSRKKS